MPKVPSRVPTTNQSSHTSDAMGSLNILQFNCNSLKKKSDEIINYMIKFDISIAAIQETKLAPTSNYNITKGY